MIKSSDAIVKKAFQDKICNCVIRIGGVPTLRFWRDLENEFSEIPVAHFTNLSFSGLSRVAPLFSIEALSALKISSDYSVLHTVKSWDQDLQKRKLPLLAKYPLSEPSLVAEFSKVIAGHPLYLGNSLPIRHWDQFSAAASKSIYANRGANGIDGQISTYLGWSEGFQHSYCLVGDLTALYDLAALGLTPQLHPGQKRVVIINNFGGQIFGRIFKNDLFINAHKTQFKHWAAMFSWDYLIVKASEDLLQMKSDHLVVEIQPDENQTKLFWDEWDLLCRKA